MKTSLTRREIMGRAFRQGSTMSWVDFLVSMEVAERVAATVRQRLQAAGIDVQLRPELVVARRSSQWEGTFAVAVRLPGVRLHDPRYMAMNEAESNEGLAALKASVRRRDIVRTWTLPRR